ncbi:MAG TPA: LysR substrate-binding domain-containing protein, partial [Rubrivivax sp.]|nr:LysR substrate-binding domain-containing protein [Rubrivivax sp.]
DIVAGRLRRVLDDYQAPDGAAYVVYPRHRQPVPAVRAFADMLREQLSPDNVAEAAAVQAY